MFIEYDPIAIHQTFREHESDLRIVAVQFAKRYKLNVEEVFSEACILFIDCYATYNPRRGNSFIGWIRWKLSKKLKSAFFSRRRNVPNIQSIHGIDVPNKKQFNFTQFVSEISEDAGELVRILVIEEEDTPPERQRLQNAKRRCGWDGRRFNRATREISTALMN